MIKPFIRKILEVTLAVLLVVCIALLTYYFFNCYQSKKLVEAIRQKDIPKIEYIVEKYPHCVNTFPSVSSLWWLAVMGIRVQFPLEVACREGDAETVIYLVEHGADVNCNDGFTPLSEIILVKPEGWHDTFYYLIDHGAELNYVTESHTRALEDAVEYKHRDGVDMDEVCDVVRYLLKHCVTDKQRIADAFCKCAGQDSRGIPVMEILMKEGHVSVDERGKLGITPLMYAAAYGDAETVEYLLSCGADVNAVDDDGETAIDWAERNGRTDIVLLLKGYKETIPD